jgi:hypothetical protein
MQLRVLALSTAGLFLSVATLAQSPASPAILPAILKDVSSLKLRHVAEFELEDGPVWRVVVQRVASASGDSADQLWLQELESAKVLISVSEPVERFRGAEVVKLKIRETEFLLTRWSRGVHGEEIRLYDPMDAKSPLKLSVPSHWPATYDVKGGVLVVRATRTGKSADTPESFEKRYPTK